MTDKKFTDEEIIRNYEWCIGCTSDRCRECTMDEEGFCEEELQDLVLDLINRQKAEIERLEKARQRQAYLSCNLRGQKYELMNRISVVKNEAYKEFAEIIKDKWFDNRYDSPNVDFDDFIDDALKELVGEDR